jgi:hypothetical protein
MNRTTAITFIALTLGCAVGATAQSVVLPLARGQTTKKFQHHCQELKWDEVLDQQNLLPEYGDAGWELATFVSAEKKGAFNTTTRIVACFKREVSG